MSRLVSRILLAVLMFPAAFIVYFACAAMSYALLSASPAPQPAAFTAAGAVTWLFVAAWWTLLWRTTVHWTVRRATLTAVAVPAAAALGAVAAWAIYPTQIGADGTAFAGGLVAIFSWLTATVFIWRETAAERKARLVASGCQVVVCPTCGYNLTGLHETRCPECGGSWTVEELMALQPAREHTEL